MAMQLIRLYIISKAKQTIKHKIKRKQTKYIHYIRLFTVLSVAEQYTMNSQTDRIIIQSFMSCYLLEHRVTEISINQLPFY